MGIEGVISISREKFDNTVSDILSRTEYRHLNNNYMSYIEKIKNYLKELIEKLFDIFAGSVEGVQVSDRVAYIVLIICIVIIAAIIVLIILRISKGIGKNKKVTELFGTVIDEASTPLDMMRKSGECKERRDYRNAVKFSFIAILLMMHKNNIIYLDETKTNGEILSVLKSKKYSHVNALEILVRIFNGTWYGHRGMTEDDFALWEQNASALWEEVSRETEG